MKLQIDHKGMRVYVSIYASTKTMTAASQAAKNNGYELVIYAGGLL